MAFGGGGGGDCGCSLRDDFGGDDFARAAPGRETVEDHQARLAEGFFEFCHAVRGGCVCQLLISGLDLRRVRGMWGKSNEVFG